MLPRVVALWLLPRYAAGALHGAFGRAVRRAIDGDDVVAAAYDALRAAEVREDGGLSGAQKDLLLRTILDGVEGGAGEVDVGVSFGDRIRALARVAAPVAAVACVGLFFVVNSEPAGADLSARGAHNNGVQNDGPLGVRVRCVQGGAVVDEASAGARETGRDLECGGSGALLAFSTTNLQAETRYAFVVGVRDDGSRVWLPPFSKDSAARALPAGRANEIVDTLAPVPAAVGDGADAAVTLFVLLDDAPFSGADVERRLDAAARSGVPLGRLDKLPVDVFAQGRLVLRAPR